ncbi:hypothetical protein ACQRIT_007816 [Beauveria bassiana]
MPQLIDTIIPAKLYNNFLIDHDATQRAEVVGLKNSHEGEILVHRDLHVEGDSNHAPINIGIAKMMEVNDSIKNGLVPLLWMVSTEGNLVAYEFGIQETLNTVDTKIKAVSTNKWSSFIEEFTNYVQSNDLSDIVSLKNRGCLSGGEYVSPSQRALFRIPTAQIHLQPGSHNLESGWVSPDGDLQPSDGHVTRTLVTAGGTVAYKHVTEEIGPDAIDPAEVSQCYIDAMWAAQKSDAFWKSGVIPGPVAATA